LDNQENGPLQLHGRGRGRDGRADVSVHGHLEPGVDHIDRTAERRVVRAGILGDHVVREDHITTGHPQHRNWSHRISQLFWYVGKTQ